MSLTMNIVVNGIEPAPIQMSDNNGNVQPRVFIVEVRNSLLLSDINKQGPSTSTLRSRKLGKYRSYNCDLYVVESNSLRKLLLYCFDET